MKTEIYFMIFFIASISFISKHFKLLTASGSLAAFLTGIFIWTGFGIKGLVLLGIFFLTSSMLSRYKRRKKAYLGEVHEKGSARDWAQVAANGGTAALAGLANLFFPDPVWLLLFSISLASANADTWASELGVLSKTDPILIKNFKKVPSGTSGAISSFGTLATGAGALLISLFAYLLFDIKFSWAAGIFLFGFAGSIIDTILGAFLQAGYKCRKCGLGTEKTIHCNVPTMKVKGYNSINNDAVNFISCFGASIAGMFFIWWII